MKKSEIIEELAHLKEIGNYRKIKNSNQEGINLSSNDYLDLGNDRELREKFYKKYSPRLSSSSSRLIDGSYEEILNLEKRAEEIYGKPCIMFNSGFDANSSLIETFYNKESLIITDRLNHASIYDGIINSKAKFLRYKHLDLNELEKLLIKYGKIYEDILVVTETVYSMDGDVADIEKIVKLKKKYDFSLMVDEAHSYGVYGYGLCYNLNLIDKIDFLVIPLGKGGGSVGAMVICDKYLKEFIVNKSRKFIFSTAIPPVNSCWNYFILERMSEFEEKRERLKELKDYTLKLLKENNISTTSSTHIISIIIGDNHKIDKITENMYNKGYKLYPVKEPTVPKGTARFRIGLNPSISILQMEKFVKELKDEIDTIF